MKDYYHLMLGQKSMHASRCFNDGFVGTDFGIEQELTYTATRGTIRKKVSVESLVYGPLGVELTSLFFP